MKKYKGEGSLGKVSIDVQREVKEESSLQQKSKKLFTNEAKLPEAFNEMDSVRGKAIEWLANNGLNREGLDKIHTSGWEHYPDWFVNETDLKVKAELVRDLRKVKDVVEGSLYINVADFAKRVGSQGEVEQFIKLFGSDSDKIKGCLERLDQAEKRLSNSSSKISLEFMEKHKRLESEAAILKDINRGLQVEVADLENGHGQLSLEEGGLYDQLEELNTRVMGLGEELQAKNEYARKMEESNALLRRDLEAQIARYQELQKARTRTEKDLDVAYGSLNYMGEKIKELTERNWELEAGTEKKNSANEIKNQKIEALEAENKKLQNQLAEVKEQLNEANKGNGLEVEELKASNQKIQDELTKVKNQLDEANKGNGLGIEALKADNQRLQDKFEETNQWFNDSMNTIGNNDLKIKALEANNQELQGELLKMEKQLNGEKDRNKALNNELVTSVAKNTELEKNYQASQGELNQVRAESQEKQQKLDQTRKEITDGDVIAQLEIVKKGKEDRKSILETEISSAQDVIDASLEEINQVKQFKKEIPNILKGSDVFFKGEKIQKLLDLIRNEGGNVEQFAEKEQNMQDLNTFLHAKVWVEAVENQHQRKLKLPLYPLDAMLRLHGRFHLTPEEFERYPSNEDILRYTKESNKEILKGMRDSNVGIRKENLNKARSKAAEYFKSICAPYDVVVEQKGETIKTKEEALEQLRMLKDGLGLGPKLLKLMTSVIESSGLKPPQTIKEINVEWNKIANKALEEAQTEYLKVFNEKEKASKYRELMEKQVARKEEQSKLVSEIKKLQKSQEVLRSLLD